MNPLKPMVVIELGDESAPSSPGLKIALDPTARVFALIPRPSGFTILKLECGDFMVRSSPLQLAELLGLEIQGDLAPSKIQRASVVVPIRK